MNGNGRYSREGRAVGVATDWLHLAATPTFLLMAVLTETSGGGSMDMPCPAAYAMSSLGGMTLMYFLMAAFHSAPWLKRVLRWWRKLALPRPRP